MKGQVVSSCEQKLSGALNKLLKHLRYRDEVAISQMFASPKGEIKEKLLILKHVKKLNEILELDSQVYYELFERQYSLEVTKKFLLSEVQKTTISGISHDQLIKSLESKNTIQDLLSVFINIRTVEAQLQESRYASGVYNSAQGNVADSGFSGDVEDHFAIYSENPL